MNINKYLKLWEYIDETFNSTFAGESWDKQKKILGPLIKKEFKLKNADIKNIFTQFETIFTDNNAVLDWRNYQLPTLIAITGKYIKTNK